MREIVLTPDMTFTDSLEFLQQNYGRRVLIEYQVRETRKWGCVFVRGSFNLYLSLYEGVLVCTWVF